MKVAYHFLVNEENSANYGHNIIKYFFTKLLYQKNLNLSSKIAVGDLLLYNLVDNQGIKEKNEFISFVEQYLFFREDNWNHMKNNAINDMFNSNVFVICIDNIDKPLAEKIDQELQDNHYPYIGGLEVDETNAIHWSLYSNSLIYSYRIINNQLYIFWDGIDKESKDAGLRDYLLELNLFNNIEFEALNGKYSIFDSNHNYENIRRMAELKKVSENFFVYMTHDVINKLDDVSPELVRKIWAAFDSFQNAEVSEQYSHVAVTCRRIIKCFADCIFPPIEDKSNEGEHKLGPEQYRNRLFAFVEQEIKSDTNKKLIFASINKLIEEIEKLDELASKGVHTSISQNGARRCLIRTILLLDDILSLKNKPFAIDIEFRY